MTDLEANDKGKLLRLWELFSVDEEAAAQEFSKLLEAAEPPNDAAADDEGHLKIIQEAYIE